MFYKTREKRSLERCVFRSLFFETGERWRAADVCRKRVPDFSCLDVERSVSSRFEVSFADFQRFFTAGPKSSRGLVGVKQFQKGTEEENSQSA